LAGSEIVVLTLFVGVHDLGTTGLPPLDGLLSQLAVSPLVDLEDVLVLLRHLYVALQQLAEVAPMAGVRPKAERLLVLQRQLRLLKHLQVSHIEVPLAVEVHIAHVGAFDLLADHLAVALDVSIEVVSGPALDVADVAVASHSVLLILEHELAVEDVVARAHECVPEDVLHVAELDFSTICEANSLVATNIQVNRVEARPHGNLSVA